ncbi:unnamed protein product [Cyprideis torosa]|uniref:Uncharacterized protein n=1 Tax=Cyprideis torosa TaxID=163714 RepID=A0A7R8W9J2_9CRUS|nr:unnamed protein product [Cyprideis torosa]CAG0889847.1 unnamed protein product [Cyprideis torosa]
MDNRDRSRSGSRSRSPAPRRNRSPGRRRSPSGSPSPKRASRKDYRSRSRSPGTRKQKHMGTRTKPCSKSAKTRHSKKSSSSHKTKTEGRSSPLRSTIVEKKERKRYRDARRAPPTSPSPPPTAPPSSSSQSESSSHPALVPRARYSTPPPNDQLGLSYHQADYDHNSVEPQPIPTLTTYATSTIVAATSTYHQPNGSAAAFAPASTMPNPHINPQYWRQLQVAAAAQQPPTVQYYYNAAWRTNSPNKPRYIANRTVDGRGNDGPGGRRRDASAYDDPEPNRVIGVFGLSLFTTERELYHIFEKYGPIDKVQVVLDAQTGRSRGFAFVYFENVDDATAAKDATSGMEIDGRKIRVDYSITTRAHTPTPGIYMGRPTRGGNRRGGYRDDYGGYRGPRRSPSPYRGGKDRYYGGGGRRSRSPYGGGRRSRSPYGGGRRSRSPYGGGRRSRSPSPYRSKYRSSRDYY